NRKMKPKSTHRYRICGTPVRTGCVTCKIRRVKCGEEKPFCKRCTSTGRKCDGYVPLDQLGNGRRGSSASQSKAKFDDPLEEKTFNFFTTVTAPKLSGYFTADFWQRRVIRASSTEPSIRHAVIAIGAIHQDFISRHENYGVGQDPSVKSFAFRQYTKAISHLHKLMSTRTQQLDITLMSCILFICFDCISGNYDSAIIHLKAGLKILEDIKKRNSQALTPTETTSAHEWEREFAPLLLNLGVQTASFVNPKYRKDRASLWRMMREARVPTSRSTFNSIYEARHALETLMADIMADRTTTEERTAVHHSISLNGQQTQRHVHLMSEWRASLDQYAATLSKKATTKSMESGINLLMVHWLLISIVINMPATSEDKFQEMMALCDTLAPLNTNGTYDSTILGFSTDIGIIAPLFFAALRAPTLNIRRQALDLLARSPRREGMWESSDAVMVAGE
ncbi:hypothetical protein B0O99DRAFT_494637, partial [Bisporella sp. PMI_857]